MSRLSDLFYKRKAIPIFYIILLSVITGLLTSCTQKEAEIQEESIPKIKIGILMYKKDDTFISSLVTYFENYVKEREQAENIKVIVNAVDGKGNQTSQNDEMDKMIAQNYDVICVNLVNRTAAASVIDKAKGADIPLVFFNREPVKEDLERWDKVYYVGAVAVESGTMQGQIIADAYQKTPEKIDKNGDGKLQYVMLEGEQNHQDTLIRAESSIKSITLAGIQVEKLANDTANWQRSQATTKMTQWIKKFGDKIEVVICNNDDMALGAIDAYQAENIEIPAIVGIDGTALALEAMREGTLLGTVYNNAKEQAKAVFDLCYALAFKKEIEKEVKLQKGKYIFVHYETVELEREEETEESK